MFKEMDVTIGQIIEQRQRLEKLYPGHKVALDASISSWRDRPTFWLYISDDAGVSMHIEGFAVVVEEIDKRESWRNLVMRKF